MQSYQCNSVLVVNAFFVIFPPIITHLRIKNVEKIININSNKGVKNRADLLDLQHYLGSLPT